MTTFDYRHDAGLSQQFVNGGYELGEVKQIAVDGHDILYRTGSALLDNSCCGSFGCTYGLVIGERIGEKPGATADAPSISVVRAIAADDALAEAIRNALMTREALGVLNFYTRVAPEAGE